MGVRSMKQTSVVRRGAVAPLVTRESAHSDAEYQQVAQDSDVHATYSLIRAAKRSSRDLTVAVFDLCDSTHFRVKHGDRDGFARVERLNYIVEYWVRKYGGVIVKHIGDGVLATFPPPESENVDPPAVRAAKCAQDVIRTLEIQHVPLNYPRAPHIAEPMSCKIAITQGAADAIELTNGRNVTVTDYLGTGLDRASRIASICRPNQILVDEQVRPHLRMNGMTSSFVVHGPYETILKGLGEVRVYDLAVDDHGPRPDMLLANVRRLPKYHDVMAAAMQLVESALADQHLRDDWASGMRGGDRPYLLIMVDFPGFGSFSFPDDSRRYLKQLSKLARGGARVSMLTLDRTVAERSCRLQDTEDDFRQSVKKEDFRRKLKGYGLPATASHDQFVEALLASDALAVEQLRADGVKIHFLHSDTRVHLWIRGEREAVVSFVMVEPDTDGGLNWNEVGFQTSDATVVTMLRNYAATLLAMPI
jgi:class 3 adenylate cyclase